MIALFALWGNELPLVLTWGTWEPDNDEPAHPLAGLHPCNVTPMQSRAGTVLDAIERAGPVRKETGP